MFSDHFLWVWTEVILLASVRGHASSLSVLSDSAVEQVGGLSNSGDHLLARDGLVRAIMLHCAFKVSGHHANGHGCVMLVPLVVPRVRMLRGVVDGATGVVGVDHASSRLVITSFLRHLLFYCAFTIGGVIVARVSALHATVIVVGAVVVANWTIHNRMLVASLLNRGEIELQFVVTT